MAMPSAVKNSSGPANPSTAMSDIRNLAEARVDPRAAALLLGGEERTHPVQVDPELLGHHWEYSPSPALTGRAAALRWNAC